MEVKTKIRTRLNTKAKVWECKFGEKWYLLSRKLNQDIIFEYQYTIIKYEVNQLMVRKAPCNLDLGPYEKRLKRDLGFDINKHNLIVKQHMLEMAELEKQKAELEKQRKEAEQLEYEKNQALKKQEKEQRRKNSTPSYEQKVLKPEDVTLTTFEQSVIDDMNNGATKKMLKRKFHMSSHEYKVIRHKKSILDGEKVINPVVNLNIYSGSNPKNLKSTNQYNKNKRKR